MHESAESDQQPTSCFTGQKINHNRQEESQTSELGWKKIKNTGGKSPVNKWDDEKKFGWKFSTEVGQ